MPEISRFFGIIITMNYNDHPPAHFHVRYGDQKALIDIERLALLEGHLMARPLGLILEWAALHRDALKEDWELARQQKPLKQVDPLE